MSYQVQIETDVAAEPVTLEEIRAYIRMDMEYTAEDSILMLLASSAREKLEGILNISICPKTLLLTGYNGSPLELPYGPVNGVQAVNHGDEIIESDGYRLSDGAFKTLSIGNQSASFFYPITGGCIIEPGEWNEGRSYSVLYEAGYDPENLPASLRQAILIQIDYDYKNQGDPNALDVSPLAIDKCKRYSRNPVI